MLKKLLIGLGILVVLLIGAAAALFGPAFIGNRPMVDGQEIGPLKVRLVKDGIVAAYVLPINDKAVALIDCGNDVKGAAILADLARHGLGPDNVQAVFLTHAHPDHIAACHLFTKAKIWAFEAEVKPAAGEERFKGPLPSKMELPVERRIKVTDLLADGFPQVMDQVTVTPFKVTGHTAGGAAFLAGGVLFLGDSANAKTDHVVAAPWIVSDDVKEDRRSLEALYRRLAPHADQVKQLAFGHSGPVDGLEALTSAWR